MANWGRTTRDYKIRKDWNDVRVDVMYQALLAKFTQNPEFKQALKSTGDSVLIERAHTDKYWAIDDDGVGENMLGKLLMLVRDKI